MPGVRVALVHDGGPAACTAGSHAAGVVVFGHSHIPWHDAGVDGQLLFNPGSPTQRRAQPHRTLGTLLLAGGQVLDAAIHALA